MTNEEYVTKILERVGPIIDVVGLFLVVKKIQEDERERCAELIPPQYFEFRDRIRARNKE